jgi:hypothetical protein
MNAKTKTKTTAAAVPVKSTRAARRLATPHKSKALRAATGAGARFVSSARDGATPLPTPAKGSIRLDLSTYNTSGLLSFTHAIRDGLNGNVYYPDLTGQVTALTAAENGMLALMDTLSSLEQQVKTIRAALDTEVINTKDILRAAATACENTDRSDEALLSVGWSLRRGPSPVKTMAAPTGLTVSATAFTGTVNARWARQSTARFYEVQAMALPTANAASPLVWAGELPSIPSTRANLDLPGYQPGALVSVRVRAVGAKGPGPWCDALTARA